MHEARRTLAQGALITLILLGAVSLLVHREFAYILRLAAHKWVISDTLTHADAVVVLGGGTPLRPSAAVGLYRSGMASRILLDDDGDQDFVLSLNVPPEAVTKFGSRLRNTYEEACALAEWAEKNAAHRFIIPTELFTARRVQWIFDRNLLYFGGDVMVDIIPTAKYTAENWWMNEDARRQFGSELSKYLYYRVRYSFAQC
jgi:uncharacterized SAM-binding protein YcdF (DUF218 family)